MDALYRSGHIAHQSFVDHAESGETGKLIDFNCLDCSGTDRSAQTSQSNRDHRSNDSRGAPKYSSYCAVLDDSWFMIHLGLKMNERDRNRLMNGDRDVRVLSLFALSAKIISSQARQTITWRARSIFVWINHMNHSRSSVYRYAPLVSQNHANPQPTLALIRARSTTKLRIRHISRSARRSPIKTQNTENINCPNLDICIQHDQTIWIYITHCLRYNFPRWISMEHLVVGIVIELVSPHIDWRM